MTRKISSLRTNLTLKLAMKRTVNYPFDIDSLISIRCFISTAKTSLFLLISSILVCLSMAPLSYINHCKFDLTTSNTRRGATLDSTVLARLVISYSLP
jgi:hypothetical protein